MIGAPLSGVGSMGTDLTKPEWNRGVWQAKLTGSTGVQWRTLMEGHYKAHIPLMMIAVSACK
jgi:hypothetical protein